MINISISITFHILTCSLQATFPPWLWYWWRPFSQLVPFPVKGTHPEQPPDRMISRVAPNETSSLTVQNVFGMFWRLQMCCRMLLTWDKLWPGCTLLLIIACVAWSQAAVAFFYSQGGTKFLDSFGSVCWCWQIAVLVVSTWTLIIHTDRNQ